MRNIRHRAVPCHKDIYDGMDRLGMACSIVWNAIRYQIICEYRGHWEDKNYKPEHKRSDFNRRFMELKAQLGFAWLNELPAVCLRETVYDQAKAWRAYEKYRWKKLNGYKIPRKDVKGIPKKRHKKKIQDRKIWTNLAFRIPSGKVKVANGKLKVPKIGWLVLRFKGTHPYPDESPRYVSMKKERGKWFAYVFYKTEPNFTEKKGDEIHRDGEEMGMDRNGRQVAVKSTSGEGEILYYPNHVHQKHRNQAKDEQSLLYHMRRLANQKKWSGRWWDRVHTIQRIHARMKNRRLNMNHHISRWMANLCVLLVMEKLDTKEMTKTGRETKEKPGENVKGIAWKNRSILETGWYQLEQLLQYKCVDVVFVMAYFTSLMCRRCKYINEDNRPQRGDFCCVSCGYTEDADVHAAENILRRGLALRHEDREDDLLGLFSTLSRE